MTERTLKKNIINEFNRSIRDAHKMPDRKFLYKPLNLESPHLCVYADASFATNEDISSQVEYIILLCNDTNGYYVLDFLSRKLRRLVRSIMGGELCTYTNKSDAVAMTVLDLARVFRREIPISMLADSKRVLDVIIRGKTY